MRVFLLLLVFAVFSTPCCVGRRVNVSVPFIFAGGDFTTKLPSTSEAAAVLAIPDTATGSPKWQPLPSIPTLPGQIVGVIAQLQATTTTTTTTTNDDDFVAFYGSFEFIQNAADSGSPAKVVQLLTSNNLALYSTASRTFVVPPCFPNGRVATAAVASDAPLFAFAGTFTGLLSASGNVQATVDGLFLLNSTSLSLSASVSASSSPCMPYFLPNVNPTFGRVQQVLLSSHGHSLFALMCTASASTVESCRVFVSVLVNQTWAAIPSLPVLQGLPVYCTQNLQYAPLAYWNTSLVVALNEAAGGNRRLCSQLGLYGSLWTFQQDAQQWFPLPLAGVQQVDQLLTNGDLLVVVNATAVVTVTPAGRTDVIALLTPPANQSTALVTASSAQLVVVGPSVVGLSDTSFAVYDFATGSWQSLSSPSSSAVSQPLGAVSPAATFVCNYGVDSLPSAPQQLQQSDTTAPRPTNTAQTALGGGAGKWSFAVDTLLDGGVVRALSFDDSTGTLFFGGSFQLLASKDEPYFIYNVAGWRYNTTGAEGVVRLAYGLPHFAPAVQALAVDADNGVLYAGGWQLGYGGGIAAFDMQAQTWYNPLGETVTSAAANVSALLLLPGGGVVVAGGAAVFPAAGNCNLFYVDVLTGQLVMLYPAANFVVTALALAPDSGWLYAAGVDQQTQRALLMRSKAWLSAPNSDWEQLLSLSATSDRIYAMAAPPSSSSSSTSVYLGGSFQHLSTALPIRNIALMIDSGAGLPQIQTLGEGIDGVVFSIVWVAQSLGIAAGSGLLVGGDFFAAGGVLARGIAYWSTAAQQWGAVAPQQFITPQGYIHAVDWGLLSGTVVQPPSGPRSYPWWLIFALSGFGLLLALAVATLVLLLVRAHRRRRRANYRYEELERLFDGIPEDGKPQISLSSLLADPLVKKIPWAELQLPPNAPVLGFGCSGTVRRGRWRDTDVAVKRLHVVDQAIDLREFLREIKLLSSLDHPNILRFHGVAIPDDTTEDVVLITELMERGSLDRLIAGGITALSPGVRLQLLLDSARGIDYLHGCKPPIIHRDLKPQNVLVDAAFHAKIADFGMSVFKSKISRSMTANVGTPIYMAPELLAATSAMYNETIDVYSWACIACEVMSGEEVYSQPQFRDVPVHALLYQIVHAGLRPLLPTDDSPLVAQLISECFQEPNLRPSFAEIAVRLERHLRSLAVAPTSVVAAAPSNSINCVWPAEDTPLLASQAHDKQE